MDGNLFAAATLVTCYCSLASSSILTNHEIMQFIYLQFHWLVSLLWSAISAEMYYHRDVAAMLCHTIFHLLNSPGLVYRA